MPNSAIFSIISIFFFSSQSFLKNLLINSILLLTGVFLFSSAFPNTIVPFGWGFVSFFAIFPIYILIYRNSLLSMPFFGFIYGFVCYLLFNSWLFVFDPNASLVVPSIYGVYFSVHFFVVKVLILSFPRFAFLLFPICWVAYEYLRTLGFLGYSFGVIGYALAFYPIFIQIVEFFGIWILCLFVVFPSSLLYQYFLRRAIVNIGTAHNSFHMHASLSGVYLVQSHNVSKYNKGRLEKVVTIVYGIFFIINIIYGIVGTVDYDQAPTKKIGLVQHNTDPWKGGYSTYKKSLIELTRLSDELLAKHNVHMVVWSETAFVPSITYHLKYKQNPQYVTLINKLLRYFEQYPDTYFLIGNGEGVRVFNEDNYQRIDYNASILFKGSKRYGVYYKLHLVPFTEYFPYTQSLAFFYNILKESDVHFWEPGTDYTVFDTSQLQFSTPICFEDGFGYQNAVFIEKGANILINITNDAWSGMEVNAMQHLQLSIIRAVENRRSVLRSTNAGMTAVIDPNGKILRMLPSFTRDYIVHDIPIYTDKTTLYTLYKDFFAQICLGISIVFILYAILLHICKRLECQKKVNNTSK